MTNGIYHTSVNSKGVVSTGMFCIDSLEDNEEYPHLILNSLYSCSSAGITKRRPMVEGARKVLWLPQGKCWTASRREEYVKELARQDLVFYFLRYRSKI